MTLVEEEIDEETNKKMEEAYSRWGEFIKHQPSNNYIQYYNEQIKPIKENEHKISNKINILFWIIITILIFLIFIHWLFSLGL